MSTPIRIKRSAVPGKIPTTSDLQLGELAINTYDGKAYLKKDVSGVETVINVGGGYPGQTYYVTKTGLDTNDGQNISAAFATVKKALTVATANDTILIGSGTYTEIFPLTVPQGVIVRGNGLRSTFIQPTAGTERLDAFLLNGENTIQDLSIGNFYYNSSTDTGYGFKFASNMVTTTRSPYIERVTVLNRGSTQTASDPYGFDTVDNYPTTKIAGRGALVDGSVVQSTTLEPAMLFNECTFITPNQTALKMTNGARTELVNSFSYFSSVSIDGVSGSVGLGSTANVTLKLAGVTTSISTNYVIKYYQGGPAVAIGTVTSVDGAYVTISGKGSGIFNAVGIGSTQDVRIFQSDGSTQVGTASTILWADYQKFGADLRAIGSASNFGTVGVRGDGAGVQLRLFGYNFGCVGSGKTFTQDPTLTIKSNEAIQLNGGRVFFQSVDQLGNFRVGTIFEISQETGAVSLASTSDINIAGTATIQNLNVIGLSTFQDPILHQDSNFNTDQTTYNLINANAGAINFAGAGTSIVIGATTGITTIRNYEVNLSGGQESYTSTTGTLTVDGGVGISSNLNVGKDLKVTGVSTFVSPVRLDSSVRVAGVSTFVSDVEANSNLRVTGVSTFTNAVRLDNKLNVAGITTFNTDVTFDTNIGVTGVSTFTNDMMLASDLNVAGITTTSTLRVTGISTLSGNVRLDNALRVAGVSTFVGDASLNSNLAVTGVSTMTGSLMVADDLRIAGVSTLIDDVMLGSDLNVAGITTTSTLKVTGISTLSGNVRLDNALRVAGVSTFVGDTRLDSNLRVAGVSTLVGNTMLNSNLNVAGISTLVGDVQLSNNLKVSGVTTFVGVTTYQNDLYVGNDLYVLGDTRIVGVLTVGSSSITLDGTENQINVGTGATLHTDRVTVTQFRASGVSTFASGVDLESNLRVTGISTFTGTLNYNSAIGTSFTNTGTAELNNVNVSGVLTAPFINSNNGVNFAQLKVTGITTLSDFTISSGIITGPSIIVIDPAGVGDNTGSVRIKGDLYVDGTQTTINSTIVEIGDKLVGLGTTAIEVVVLKTNGNASAASSIITGISTDRLVVGYAVSANSSAGAGSSIVSIGSSAVTLSANATNSTNVILTDVTINPTTTSISGVSTSGLIVGAGLTSIYFQANTTITSLGTGSINFSPASTNVGIATTNVTVTNLGTFTFVDSLTGDFLADGGGILLYGKTNKTFTWSDSTDSWTSSENLRIATSRILKIGASDILSETDLTIPLVTATTGNITNVNSTYLTATNSVISGIITSGTLVSNIGLVTSLSGTNLNYSGIGTIDTIQNVNLNHTGIATLTDVIATNLNVTGIATIQTLNVPTEARFRLINDANISGVTTVNSFITTSFYATGVGTFSNLVYINAGIATRFDATNLNLIQGTQITVGIATTTGTFVGLNTNIVGVDTTGLAVGDAVSGTYITVGTLVNGIGNTSITLSFSSSSPVGTSTTSLTFTRVITPAGVGTIPNLRSTNVAISGIASIAAGIVTDLIVGLASVSTLNVNVGYATVFAATSGIITSLYTTGVGTVSTLYVNSGITTRSTITDLDVVGVGTFATIANVNTPLGLSTIGHLTGANISYSGIGTIQTLNVGLATITTLNVTGISSLPNLYGSDIQYTGISTLTELRGTNLYYSGLSTAVNFRSTDTIVSGAASISTLRADVGITTNAVWTDGYSAGITSVANLRSNVGIITTLTVTNSTQGYLIGTDIYYSGIGTIDTLRTNVGFATFLSGINLSYTGVSTVVSFNATDVNVSGTTTISTLLISPNNQLSYLSNGVNLAFSGIGTIDTLRSNVGFVTTLSGTNLNYSGIGTISTIQNINLNSTGIATFVDVNTTNLNVTGIGTVATLNITSASFTRLNSVDQIISGVSSISTLSTNVGVVTHLTATDLTVTGVGTINTIRNVDLNTTGIGTIATFNATNIKSTGISTFNTLIASTIQTDALDLSGTAINFTGIATFNTLFSTNGTINYLRGDTLNFTGINTLGTIYTADINSTGFTTTRGLHVGVGGTILTAVNSSGIGSVGINTSSPKRALQVYGELQINGNTVVGTISTTRSNNSAVKVHTSLGRDEFRTVEYTVQASIGNTHQVTKILSIHDGVTAYNSEYSNVSTGVDVATYDVQIDNTVPPGFIALVVTPVSNVGVTTIVVNYTATRI